MAISTERTSTNGQRAADGARTPRPASRRHRQTPLVVVGVLLVLGCALAFTDASLHLGSRQEVLVVAQPLAAGQVLTTGDLRSARVTTGSGLGAVPAAQEASVVGRAVAVPLVAGALLSPGEVGSAPPVGAGSDVVAVAVKAGGFPPDLTPGDRVQVVPVASSSGSATSGGASAGSPIAATVLAVQASPADSDSGTVFSLQVAKADADEVASLAAAGQAALVQVGAGGGG
jgi:hypothetical protein